MCGGQGIGRGQLRPCRAFGDGWGLLQAVPNLSAEAVQMPPELSTAQREALLG